jgi:hypothetical protein
MVASGCARLPTGSGRLGQGLCERPGLSGGPRRRARRRTVAGVLQWCGHDRGPRPPDLRRSGEYLDGAFGQPGIRGERRFLGRGYSGYKGSLDLEKTPIYIGLARSKDGVTWIRSECNPVLGPANRGSWNDLCVVLPHVIVEDDGSLQPFAHGQSRHNVGRALGGRSALGRLGV